MGFDYVLPDWLRHKLALIRKASKQIWFDIEYVKELLNPLGSMIGLMNYLSVSVALRAAVYGMGCCAGTTSERNVQIYSRKNWL